MSKFTRQISIVGALLLLFGGAIAFRFFQNQKAPPKRKPPVTKVFRQATVSNVQNQSVASDLDVQGRLVAFNKIDIFSEVSGKLMTTAKPFKVGSYFRKGDILLNIDASEAELSLLSQKANLMNAITRMMPDIKIDYPESAQQWKSYLDQFDVRKPLPVFPDPLNEQEKYFVAANNLHTQYYTIKSQEERLSKYIVRAPFSGALTQTAVNPGSLVRAGQKTGELMNTANYELEATVRLADLEFVKVGNQVVLYSTELGGEWKGKVKRISDQIDPNTQTVIAYIGLNGRNLREGMYLRGKIKGKTIADAVEVDRELIVNQNALFLVGADSLLNLQEVQILTMDDESAIVRGLKDGDRILASIFPGAYNGQKIIPLTEIVNK